MESYFALWSEYIFMITVVTPELLQKISKKRVTVRVIFGFSTFRHCTNLNVTRDAKNRKVKVNRNIKACNVKASGTVVFLAVFFRKFNTQNGKM